MSKLQEITTIYLKSCGMKMFREKRIFKGIETVHRGSVQFQKQEQMLVLLKRRSVSSSSTPLIDDV